MSLAGASKATTAVAAHAASIVNTMKSQSVIFVEDIANHVVSQVQNRQENQNKIDRFPEKCCWTSIVIHQCILKACGSATVVFKAGTDIVPVAFSAVFDATNPAHMEHSYNALIVKAGGSSAFSKSAPRLRYNVPPTSSNLTGVESAGGGVAGASLRSVMSETKKKFEVCVGTLDRCIEAYEETDRSKDKAPANQVVPGFSRLDATKFLVDRSTFYEVISLNPEKGEQRQIALNEFIILHNILISIAAKGTNIRVSTPKKTGADTYLIDNKVFTVSASFDERLTSEAKFKTHPKPKMLGVIHSFQFMLDLVEKFQPQNMVRKLENDN